MQWAFSADGSLSLPTLREVLGLRRNSTGAIMLSLQPGLAVPVDKLAQSADLEQSSMPMKLPAEDRRSGDQPNPTGKEREDDFDWVKR